MHTDAHTRTQRTREGVDHNHVIWVARAARLLPDRCLHLGRGDGARLIERCVWCAAAAARVS
jgi:hypothetical protein